eukprot:CAMPEP_0202919846 /NCGR_PEP_ID=MMETSP1392-20130828/76544_1 /ASSEMBLY_ACC=CAM_ASM_000868 /TAXON_ID=225041 /ORGANISM="Chlamydomonas chlamydogama, Strain SAG 11-48b" /LENGTH=291 /DNA_ID=CAMNT_0049613307 /DNA_START=129 /DNA_END=1005 /DNA_ORIENTATION=-
MTFRVRLCAPIQSRGLPRYSIRSTLKVFAFQAPQSSFPKPTAPLKQPPPEYAKSVDRLALQRADEDLREYCEAHGNTEQHLRVLNWYESKWKAAQSECQIASASLHTDDGCEPLHRLEAVVRETVSCGDMDSLYRQFAVMELSERRRAAQANQEAASSQPNSCEMEEEELEEEREWLTSLFDSMDKNHDGRLSMLEFQSFIQEEEGLALSDEDLQAIITSVQGQDLHNGLTLEEFIAAYRGAQECAAMYEEGTDATSWVTCHITAESSSWGHAQARADGGSPGQMPSNANV